MNKIFLLFIIIFSSLFLTGCQIPEHFDKSTASNIFKAERNVIFESVYDALLTIGCDDIKIYKFDNETLYIGKRKFLYGVFCGSGGETLSVSIKTLSKKESKYKVTLLSFKDFPYFAAAKFKIEEFFSAFNKYLTIHSEFINDNLRRIHLHYRYNIWASWFKYSESEIYDKIKIELNKKANYKLLDIQKNEYNQFEWEEVHLCAIAVKSSEL